LRADDADELICALGRNRQWVAQQSVTYAACLVVEFKKEVAKMREREATDLATQSMLEFVEQLTHWRGDGDREPLINQQLGRAQDKAIDAATQAEEAIRRNPTPAVAMALGVGFLLGVFTRR
jgi:ElaB/YqjD/DUF883 family membrane-anchored ribosome-binding protein